MSFQDVGRSNSKRRTASASLQKGSQSRSMSPTTPSMNMGATGGGPASIAQISESLNQYQRNVGILEKLAQQLIVSITSNANTATVPRRARETQKELSQQYDVQLDVVQQLESRVRRQLDGADKQQQQQLRTKLERDFQRVQSTAQSCRTRVTRFRDTAAAAAASAAKQIEENPSDSNVSNEVRQQQLQQQMLQDRLQEEIMREREEEIRNINRGMHQVNEIYKDLANIVGSQQEQVDQIETQMDEARTNAESGLEQVQKANEKYNSGPGQCAIM